MTNYTHDNLINQIIVMGRIHALPGLNTTQNKTSPRKVWQFPTNTTSPMFSLWYYGQHRFVVVDHRPNSKPFWFYGDAAQCRKIYNNLINGRANG